MTIQRKAYTVAQFCERWGISRSTLYRLMQDGILTGYTVGRRRFLSDDQDRRFAEYLLPPAQRQKEAKHD